jgi:hypothetical protein
MEMRHEDHCHTGGNTSFNADYDLRLLRPAWSSVSEEGVILDSALGP